MLCLLDTPFKVPCILGFSCQPSASLGFPAQHFSTPPSLRWFVPSRGLSLSPELHHGLGWITLFEFNLALLPGTRWFNRHNALLQDPGVGGRFCRKAGLRLGPTRPDGVPMATLVCFEFSCLDLVSHVSSFFWALFIRLLCFFEDLLLFPDASVHPPEAVNFSRIGVFCLTDLAFHKCALYLQIPSSYCLERVAIGL
jgi:hypothetical protein